MNYRQEKIKPDRVSTVHLNKSLYDEIMRFYNRRLKLSDRHIFLSEIIRDAINSKINKIGFKKGILPKKPTMNKRINFTLTNDLWKRLKLCASQTSKSQNQFIRDALKEYLEKYKG